MTMAFAPGGDGRAPTIGLPAPDDRRWLTTLAVVGGMMAFGVLFAYGTANRLQGYNLSTRFSFLYIPVSMVLILAMGWSRLAFPVAASLFYAYLGVNQNAANEFWLVGDWNAAITFEMVLAIPLIIVGLAGTSAAAEVPSRPIPSLMKWAWILIPLAGLLSCLFSIAFVITFATLMGKVVLPILVTLGVYRRCRDLGDVRLIWYGAMVGMLVITVFDFRRAVMGEVTLAIGERANQRYVGATMSFGIPMIFLLGGALWLGYARAVGRSFVGGMLFLFMAAVIGMLIWLSGTRGTTLGFGVLVLWWFGRRGIGAFFSFRGMLVLLIGGVMSVALVAFSFGYTAMNVGLTIERFKDLFQHGVTEEARWPIWVTAMHQLAANPVLGLGPNAWTVTDFQYESVHSSVIGVLYDLGIVGAILFSVLFIESLLIGRRAYQHHLSHEDREFFLGCRAGWIAMLLVLATNLSFTSGQFKNNIFSYMVFFYPLMAMLVYCRSAALSPAASPMETVPGGGGLVGAIRREGAP